MVRPVGVSKGCLAQSERERDQGVQRDGRVVRRFEPAAVGTSPGIQFVGHLADAQLRPGAGFGVVGDEAGDKAGHAADRGSHVGVGAVTPFRGVEGRVGKGIPEIGKLSPHPRAVRGRENARGKDRVQRVERRNELVVLLMREGAGRRVTHLPGEEVHTSLEFRKGVLSECRLQLPVAGRERVGNEVVKWILPGGGPRMPESTFVLDLKCLRNLANSSGETYRRGWARPASGHSSR